MTHLISRLKTKLSIQLNRLRRLRGPALRDQCAAVIMRMCTIQLDRDETRELAPTPGAMGPMVISGGAITKITYSVFDRNADRVNKEIKQESWRAFARITMLLTIERDPEFQVEIDGQEVEPKAVHTAPGIALVRHLATYFPLLPKAHCGPLIKPEIA